ncbi:alpha/beta hydrolase [Novosphingobium resinovorum]
MILTVAEPRLGDEYPRRRDAGGLGEAMDTMTRAMPAFLPDGSVQVPAFTLPVSGLVSEEAAALQRLRAAMPVFDASGQEDDIAVRRAQINAYMAPQIERLRATFPVIVTRGEIGGVEVLDVTPVEGGHDPQRVLINLHGGAFCVGWDGVALVEAIPIAALGRIRVVSVNYRMAPEHRHPAGVEDVAAVYRALLADYAPGRIGIYGGSAGGALTAQAAAWLASHDLPQAGAIGVFGAGQCPSARAIGLRHGLHRCLVSPPLPMEAPLSISRADTSQVAIFAIRAPGPAGIRRFWQPSSGADRDRDPGNGPQSGHLHAFAAAQGEHPLQPDCRGRHGALLPLPGRVARRA